MKQPTYEQLREYYDSTYGTWMIDRDPKEVDIDWIRQNAFQTRLTDANKINESITDMQKENKFGSSVDEQSDFDKDLMEKIREYKDSIHKSDQLDDIALRMADQLDYMITSNRETIRMKCLEAALKFFLSKEGKLTPNNVINLAEEFYKFVKGESLHKSE